MNFSWSSIIINSNENLSVQVHPNDDYARRVENSFGKTEAWYVISLFCWISAITSPEQIACTNPLLIKKASPFLTLILFKQSSTVLFLIVD